MISVRCKKCGKIVPFKENVPARLACSSCGNTTIFFKSDNPTATKVKLKCNTCEERFEINLNEEFDCHHDKPNCKSLTWFINPMEKAAFHPVYVKQQGKDLPKEKVVPIGVTVIVLCHNQLKITQQCLDHIRKSTVNTHIILVDNGSELNVEDWAKGEMMKGDFSYIGNQINLGCGIGRNEGAKWATTDYIMFLDNDQFISSDYIEKCLKVGKDLVGCELWEVSSDGSTYRPPKNSIGLRKNSYIGSGGLLVRRKVFEALKGYDERFAPAWFEDVDFFFRARACGYSAGVIEDHKVQHLGGATSDFQKTFDTSLAKTNGRKLFMQIWGALLGNAPSAPIIEPKKEEIVPMYRPLVYKNIIFGDKPKIVIFADVKGWAWDYKAQSIKKHLQDSYDISIFYIAGNGDPGINWSSDICFFFEGWREIEKGIPWATGVTAHTYVNLPHYPQVLIEADAIHANSRMLFEEVRTYNKNCFYLPNGVDQQLFNYKRKKKTKDFVVGYVGKPIMRKGFVQFVRPACEKAGVVLKALTVKYNEQGKKLHDEMPDFYEDVDCIMVASDMDGTPNQLLEAASVGRMCIGNEIGNIPEFIKDGVNGFIVARNIDAYVEKLNYLKENRDVCIEMGKKARETVDKEWTWEIQADNYRSLFNHLLF